MGVHTGDSITVAPALTLTDKEYQIMRDASIAVLREIGVETGGSNVQFAVNPADGRLVVIEMNPRVSRSSALASKATGFPIAKVAAKLAVGYTLDEIANDITGGATPASFEPTIDYVVTKIPRFAFEKFPGAEPVLTTSMKSVGEAMAIGRTFQESLQKALRSLETGLTGLDEIAIEGVGQGDDKNAIRAALGTPTPDRLLKVAQAMRLGVDRRADPSTPARSIRGSSRRSAASSRRKREITAKGLPATPRRAAPAQGDGLLRRAARQAHRPAPSRGDATQRHALGVRPVFKRIDTCAAEFASPTAYMYSTYETPFAGALADEAAPSDKKKVVILGGGPNRIGQGIEFDYCCCHACFALQGRGLRDHHDQLQSGDGVDRLRHLGPALFRAAHRRGRARDHRHRARATARCTASSCSSAARRRSSSPRRWKQANVPILGTSPDAIDLAEDRDRFKQLLDKLGLQPAAERHRHQPERGARDRRRDRLSDRDPAVLRARRPRAWRSCTTRTSSTATSRGSPATSTGRPSSSVSDKRPLLIDRYLSDAIEVDVDCLADGKDTFIAGIMEHIEEAGIHSGDSACALPPHSLDAETIAELERQTRALALALNVGGLMNVQYAIKDGDIYVLEVNPRASRTVPFVAKVIGLPVAKIAARVMAGETLASFELKPPRFDHVGVKEAVFPFARFPGRRHRARARR